MEQLRTALCRDTLDRPVMLRSCCTLETPQTGEGAGAQSGVPFGFAPQNAQKERKWTRSVLRRDIGVC